MDERASKKVVIDAGHGGTDPGTIANGITEKDYTLKISQYIQKRLDDLGIENSMTRTGDETLGPNVRPQRAQSFYGNGRDIIVLSNHINAGGGDGQSVTNKCITIKAKYRNKWIINHKKQLIYKLL